MKKLSILFLSVVALATTVTSCSKNDAAPSIVAKWNYTTFTHTTSTSTTDPAPITSTTCTDKSYLDLRDGGVMLQQLVGTSADPCVVNTTNGNYTYQSNILHLTSAGGSLNYTVVSITSSKLVVKSINPNDSTEYLTVTLTK